MTDVAGLCDICNKPSSNLNTCRLCGAKVCPEHYNPETGLCSNCERGPQIKDIKKVLKNEKRRILRTLK